MAEKVVYKLRERVDANNAQEIQKELDELTADASIDLTIDFVDNKYISSAGLRTILLSRRR